MDIYISWQWLMLVCMYDYSYWKLIGFLPMHNVAYYSHLLFIITRVLRNLLHLFLLLPPTQLLKKYVFNTHKSLVTGVTTTLSVCSLYIILVCKIS